MTENLNIRQETNDDFKKVYELNINAFGQDSEAKLVDALRKNPIVFVPELSIVATVNNIIVGHILFTKIHIKDDSGNLHESLGLAPMAVKTELQKKE